MGLLPPGTGASSAARTGAPDRQAPKGAKNTGGSDGVSDSQFQDWLMGSSELQVMMSTDGANAPRCKVHPKKPVVAACTRCNALLDQLVHQ